MHAEDYIPRSISGQETARLFRRRTGALGKQVRNDMAHVCKFLRPGYIAAADPSERNGAIMLTRRALRVMHAAALDCFDADRMSATTGNGYSFLQHLTLRSHGQMRSVDFFALRPDLMGWENKDTTEAWNAGDEGKAREKHWLHVVRGMLKSSMSAQQVVRSLEEHGVLREMGSSGWASFFVTLGDTLRDSPVESCTQRILKAWIPLNFAACPPDGRQAHDLFELYSKALKQPAVDYVMFKTGWNNVRNKHLAQLRVWLKKSDPATLSE